MSDQAKKIFRKKMRGYDEAMVDSFIANLNKEAEQNQQQIAELEKQNAECKAELETVKNELEALKDSLSARERAADEISRVALKEANVIVDTASKNADSIIRESLATARQILVEMSKLGNEALFMKKSIKEQTQRLNVVIEQFSLPSVPSLDCLDLFNEDK